jgi:rare lipoprotein A
MHKKHSVSLAGILMAASLTLSPSPANLHAEASGTADTAGDTAAGTRFLIAEGKASYYANRFHGRRTASGEHFDRRELTAAHRSLPFGTRVQVTNLDNGRKVFVKINDRGPHTGKRIIDISQAAAREIGLVGRGVGKVRIEAYN